MTNTQRKSEAKVFLGTINFNVLRCIGRMAGVAQPTTLAKATLSADIVDILCGDTKANKLGQINKIGEGTYTNCEIVLDQLKAMLDIDDNDMLKALKHARSTRSLCAERINSAPMTLDEHISAIVAEYPPNLHGAIINEISAKFEEARR